MERSKFLELIDEFGRKITYEFIERNGELTDEEISELESIPDGINAILIAARGKRQYEHIKNVVQDDKT